MVELIIVPIITFYMIKRGDDFCRSFIRLFPAAYEEHLRILFHEIHYVLSAYIRGQLALCILMAIVVFIGMMALGIPYPLVIGLLAGLVEMVPILGPIIGAVPPALLGLTQSSGVMLKVIVFYIIVQQLDSHLIMPKLMGSIINVHPVAIILGVLVGGHLYGIVGMMVAVPLLAVLQVILKHMWFYERYKSGWERRSADENPNLMNTLKERIKEKKYKLTRQRKIVLQAFWTVRKSYERGRRICTRKGRKSGYRASDSLSFAGAFHNAGIAEEAGFWRRAQPV